MRIGIIGCGGMGTTHSLSLKALSSQYEIEVVALADCRNEFLEKASKIWPNAKKYEFGMNLIKEEKLDLVHICLPSYLHAEHAVAAMEMGMHVFVEKPVCLTEDECKMLLDTKNKTGVNVMVGQVVRCFPEYQYLKQIYDEKQFGNLKSIVLQRLSGDATWGFENWYHDEEKSGSVILDLHIHDLDFLRYMAGEPETFHVVAARASSGTINQVIAQYQFEGFFATAEALWDVSTTLAFEASFRAVFEEATIIFNSRRKPSLTVYQKNGKILNPQFPLLKEFETSTFSAGINISDLGPYYAEIKYFIECLIEGNRNMIAPLEEGVKSVQLAMEEFNEAKKYLEN